MFLLLGDSVAEDAVVPHGWMDHDAVHSEIRGRIQMQLSSRVFVYV